MYVTSGNEMYALDAGSGRQIWHYQRARTKGQIGNAGGGINRGAAVAGDRVFMATDNAHLIALDRMTGALLWDIEMADWRQNYGATGAPLTVGPTGDLRRVGRRRRCARVRGRIRTQQPEKKPGASGRCRSAASPDPRRGRATRSITPAAPHGSPGRTIPSSTRCIGRLEIRARISSATIGSATISTRARWWRSTPGAARSSGTSSTRRMTSGTSTRSRRPRSIDMVWRGEPRKLLIQAHRNGFFYVLDRTNGTLSLGHEVRGQPDVGDWADARRPADRRAEPGRDARGQPHLPARQRRHQLVLDVLQPGDRAVLRADQRMVQHPDAHAGRVGGGKGLLRRLVPRRGEPAAADAHPAGDRRADRPRRVAAARRPAHAIHGAARSARPAAWCSSARRAARSWPWMPSTAAALAVPDQPVLECVAR